MSLHAQPVAAAATVTFLLLAASPGAAQSGGKGVSIGERDSEMLLVAEPIATVQRLRKRWAEAQQASDRAIAALEAADNPQARQALAGVYSNRALMLVEQEQYEVALAYSDKALAILKVTFAGEPKDLEPFLDDNRRIREKLGLR